MANDEQLRDLKGSCVTVRPGLVVEPGPSPSPLPLRGGGAVKPVSDRVWKQPRPLPDALFCGASGSPLSSFPGALSPGASGVGERNV
jgi:hypothetical protein